MFIHPTVTEEIANISTLNMNKSSGPNSIPYRILNLLKIYNLKQLADLFNLSLSSVVFPSLLKIAKLVPVYKRIQSWIVIIIALSLSSNIKNT